MKSLLDVGFNFNYTYSLNLRFLMMHKLGLKSNRVMPKIKKLELYSYIDNIETFWNNKALGSFLLLFFVTGSLPVILRFRAFQTFKKTTYNITVSVSLNRVDIGDFLIGFSFNVLESASILDQNFRFYSRMPGLYSFVLSDWVALKELTVHPVFFKWREDIFGKFFISNGLSHYNDFFMSLFRLNI